MSSADPPAAGPGVVGTVTSRDGTAIGYRSWGSGPGVVVLHGAMESSGDYSELATMLGGTMTVHVPDRRGRGLSGPHRTDHELADEIDDVHALVQATSAEHLFGISSGGVVALRAAVAVPGLSTVGAYEPAISLPGVDETRSRRCIECYEQAIARGDSPAAIVAILRGLQVGPRWLRLLPRPVATALIRRLGAEDERRAVDGDVTFVSLAPTMHHDFRISDQGSGDLEELVRLERPVLLLGGDRSPGYLSAALDALVATIPTARRVTLRRAGHTAASNGGDGGRPEHVAAELLRFLEDPDGATTP